MKAFELADIEALTWLIAWGVPTQAIPSGVARSVGLLQFDKSSGCARAAYVQGWLWPAPGARPTHRPRCRPADRPGHQVLAGVATTPWRAMANRWDQRSRRELGVAARVTDCGEDLIPCADTAREHATSARFAVPEASSRRALRGTQLLACSLLVISAQSASVDGVSPAASGCRSCGTAPIEGRTDLATIPKIGVDSARPVVNPSPCTVHPDVIPRLHQAPTAEHRDIASSPIRNSPPRRHRGRLCAIDTTTTMAIVPFYSPGRPHSTSLTSTSTIGHTAP
jgi:hypothetical protein